jgi:hypothetical protein
MGRNAINLVCTCTAQCCRIIGRSRDLSPESSCLHVMVCRCMLVYVVLNPCARNHCGLLVSRPSSAPTDAQLPSRAQQSSNLAVVARLAHPFLRHFPKSSRPLWGLDHSQATTHRQLATLNRHLICRDCSPPTETFPLQTLLQCHCSGCPLRPSFYLAGQRAPLPAESRHDERPSVLRC